MKKIWLGLALVVVAFPLVAAAQQTRSIASVMNDQLSRAEREFTGAAEAMPEEKYGFAPTNGEFKGVRTFAEEVRHVAMFNYLFGAAILGEKPPAPVDGPNENGPVEYKTKTQILQYLKDSFAYGHKAFATLDEQRALEPIQSRLGDTRLAVAALNLRHCNDHYGQMVEYLRMNGIIPPASRPQPSR